MGINLQDLIGGSIADGIGKIIGLFKIDPTVALEKKVELEKLQFEMQSKVLDSVAQMSIAQNEVNKAEATNTSLFIAGWRPYIGWVCGTGLAFQFLVGPIVTWLAALNGKPVVFPTLDMGTLLTLLLGMLGLGGMRTYEKINGLKDDPNKS